ncbi:MAG: DUF4391 domain-containing protein [Lachnospiraceae bacterium oral taxon 082]|nr:DUF4391 domain-containing protein [Lachnospiraceae bacterium oral taxon 082]
MIGLPKTTEFNKRIPKQKFYENMDISPALKRIFTEQVKTIYWRNKIAVSTINLAGGNDVTEIEVFEIRLNSKELDDAFLRQIDREIPYHILFLLEYGGKYQARIGYKETLLSGKNTFKVNAYYQTEWMDEDNLPLKLEGLSIEAVYENFVRQVAGDRLKAKENSESLKKSVTRDEEKQSLQKQIDNLKAKIRKEAQLNRQMEMNSELKVLIKKLETM